MTSVNTTKESERYQSIHKTKQKTGWKRDDVLITRLPNLTYNTTKN